MKPPSQKSEVRSQKSAVRLPSVLCLLLSVLCGSALCPLAHAQRDSALPRTNALRGSNLIAVTVAPNTTYGTQTITVSNFYLQVFSNVVAGSNVLLSINPTNQTLTILATNSGGGSGTGGTNQYGVLVVSNYAALLAIPSSNAHAVRKVDLDNASNALVSLVAGTTNFPQIVLTNAPTSPSNAVRLVDLQGTNTGLLTIIAANSNLLNLGMLQLTNSKQPASLMLSNLTGGTAGTLTITNLNTTNLVADTFLSRTGAVSNFTFGSSSGGTSIVSAVEITWGGTPSNVVVLGTNGTSGATNFNSITFQQLATQLSNATLPGLTITNSTLGGGNVLIGTLTGTNGANITNLANLEVTNRIIARVLRLGLTNSPSETNSLFVIGGTNPTPTFSISNVYLWPGQDGTSNTVWNMAGGLAITNIGSNQVPVTIRGRGVATSNHFEVWSSSAIRAFAVKSNGVVSVFQNAAGNESQPGMIEIGGGRGAFGYFSSGGGTVSGSPFSTHLGPFVSGNTANNLLLVSGSTLSPGGITIGGTGMMIGNGGLVTLATNVIITGTLTVTNRMTNMGAFSIWTNVLNMTNASTLTTNSVFALNTLYTNPPHQTRVWVSVGPTTVGTAWAAEAFVSNSAFGWFSFGASSGTTLLAFGATNQITLDIGPNEVWCITNHANIGSGNATVSPGTFKQRVLP